MKKVAFYIPVLNIGGAERVVLDLLKQFDRDSSYEVYLISDISQSQLVNQIPENINLIQLKDKQRLGPISKLRLLAVMTAKYKFDVLISNLTHANIHALVSKVLFRWSLTKCVIVEHSILTSYLDSVDSPKHKILKVLSRLFYKFAEKIVCVSECVKLDLIENFKIEKSKLCVIYNSVDSNKINNAIEETLPDDFVDFCGDNRVVILVGRLELQKNPKLAVAAFIELLKTASNYRLVLVGSGSLRTELELYSKQNKLDGLIWFAGFQTNPYKYIAKADMLLLSSDFEGFGIVLIEAMYLKKQIVSVDIPTSREILENGKYGLLCDANPESIAKAIDTLLGSPINKSSIFDKGKEFLTPVMHQGYSNLINELD
jgi:glycosyltransferase involved in cell wall biosynthesis